MKKPLSLILALVLCLALALPALADDPITVTVNGKAVEWTDAQPFIDENSRTMVPLRAVANALGLTVVWYAGEREAAFTDGSKVIYFPIGGSTATAYGGEDVTMDTAAVIVNERTYAPARYLAEFFGYEVGWDGETRTVIITKGQDADFVCGETEPHQWKKANYQAPETCAVCGATQGEPLAPDFVTHEMKADMEIGKHYNYETICYDDHSVKTVGDVTLLDYSIIRSDDTHEAKAGYEWRVVTFELTFADEHALEYAAMPAYANEDYYNIRLFNDNLAVGDFVTVGDVVEGESLTRTITSVINYYGEDMECLFHEIWRSIEGQEDGHETYTFTFSFQVPVGYDGCVSGWADAAIYEEWSKNGYTFFDHYDPDGFLLFRLA